jgi:alkylation response protein AidB-like acyl-CoA dehydrogenase
MIATDSLIAQTTARIYADHGGLAVLNAADRGAFAAPLWDALVEAGLTLALTSEAQGGFGADMAEVLGAVHASAAAASPVPFAETLIANYLCAAADLPPVAGRASFALPGAMGQADVPFAAHIDQLVLFDPAHGQVSLFECRDLDIIAQPALSPDGMGRVMLSAAQVSADGQTTLSLPAVQALILTVRAVQMAASLQAGLDLAIAHVTTREQFGRPLAKFQAIQQQLAVAASECAAASMAATLAADALAADPETAWQDAVCAKIAIGEATESVTASLHQVHGAIGYTFEYGLHHHSRRLWAWRDTLGNEAYWAARLGAHIAAAPAGHFWQGVTGAARYAS